MSPRLVGFDATALEVRQRSGVSHYTAQLLAALVARDDGHRYALLASRSLRGQIPDGTLGQVGTQLPNRWLWMQFVLPAILARLRPEVCHFTNSVAPLASPCPFVITLYDMSLFLHGRTQPRKSLWLIRTLIPLAVRRAAAIITLSRSTRDDILAVLGPPPAKVHVAYAAPGREYRVIHDTSELERVRRRYALHRPFVLAVGTVEPRKNLGRLVQALAEVHRRGRTEELVLVGQLGWRYKALLRQIDRLNLGNAVRFLGYVPDEDLPSVYNLASVLAFPSLYEGFGLPIVQSMACGTPVLTSNRSAMAEVGAGAALLVDPTTVDALADGLGRLLADQDLREQLCAAGLARAAEFSWSSVAERTVQVYAGIPGGKG